MSFILKALKKLEEEKSAQRARPHDISSALLTPERLPVRTSRWSPKRLAVLAACLVTAGLAVILLRQRSTPVPRTPAAVPAAVAIPASQPVQPQAFPAATPPAAGALSGSSAPAESAADRNPAMPAGRAPKPAAGKTLPSIPPARVAEQPREERTSQRVTAAAPTGLKVSGIALQDDPSESVAVINGALVKKGMSVEGARIEEIFRDRVRFSGADGQFEVQLSR